MATIGECQDSIKELQSLNIVLKARYTYSKTVKDGIVLQINSFDNHTSVPTQASVTSTGYAAVQELAAIQQMIDDNNTKINIFQDRINRYFI